MADFFEDDALPQKKGESFFEEDAVPVDGASAGEMADYATSLVVDPAKELLQTLVAPLVEMEKVTGAAPRAAVGAMQRGEGLEGGAKAFVDQAVAGFPKATGPGEVLPTTPTGEEIAETGMKSAGIPKDYRSKMAPAAGLMAELGLDLTNLIPGTPATSTAKGLRKGVMSTIGAAESAAAHGVMGAGRIATMGALDYRRAMKAVKRLKAGELIFPGNPSFGPMAKAMAEVGDARLALQENKIAVPGSHETAIQIADIINTNKGRTLDHTGADQLIAHIRSRAFDNVEREVPEVIPPQAIEQAILATESEIANAKEMLGNLGAQSMAPSMQQAQEAEKLIGDIGIAEGRLAQIKSQYASGQPFTTVRKEVVQVPRDLTLDELDDLTGMFDNLVYTPAGNAKGLRRIWGPALKKSRAALDELMQTVPEGKLFKEKKSQQEALMTAAKGRSKLVTTASLTTGLGFEAQNLMEGDLSIHPAALVALAIQPQTFFKIMGVLKVPGGMARKLFAAQETGKLAVMRDALKEVAEAHPFMTERLIRASVLVAGKPTAQQFLTEQEAQTLGLHREFDPEAIMAERSRIDSDKSLSSVQKAKALSEINKNGYIIVDTPKVEPENVQERVFGGPEGLKSLMESLQRAGG